MLTAASLNHIRAAALQYVWRAAARSTLNLCCGSTVLCGLHELLLVGREHDHLVIKSWSVFHVEAAMFAMNTGMVVFG